MFYATAVVEFVDHHRNRSSMNDLNPAVRTRSQRRVRKTLNDITQSPIAGPLESSQRNEEQDERSSQSSLVDKIRAFDSKRQERQTTAKAEQSKELAADRQMTTMISTNNMGVSDSSQGIFVRASQKKKRDTSNNSSSGLETIVLNNMV